MFFSLIEGGREAVYKEKNKNVKAKSRKLENAKIKILPSILKRWAY